MHYCIKIVNFRPKKNTNKTLIDPKFFYDSSSCRVNQVNKLTSHTPSSLRPPAHSFELVIGIVPL